MSHHPCGTLPAYHHHFKTGNPVCQPCRHAYNQYRTRLRNKTRPEKPPTYAETIAEIERLLRFGEGEHAILKATGYNKEAHKRLLHRAQRTDLTPRIFNGDKHMVWAA